MQAQIKSIQERLASRNTHTATPAYNAKPGCEGDTYSSLQKSVHHLHAKSVKKRVLLLVVVIVITAKGTITL